MKLSQRCYTEDFISLVALTTLPGMSLAQRVPLSARIRVAALLEVFALGVWACLVMLPVLAIAAKFAPPLGALPRIALANSAHLWVLLPAFAAHLLFFYLGNRSRCPHCDGCVFDKPYRYPDSIEPNQLSVRACFRNAVTVDSQCRHCLRPLFGYPQKAAARSQLEQN